MMKKTSTALLNFRQNFNLGKKKLRDGLSGVVSIGNTLWIANDEMISLERFLFQGQQHDGTYLYGDHEQFDLDQYIELPAKRSLSDPIDIEEADIEGLDYHNGYLWLVGSHSLKRKKPIQDEPVKENLKRLAKINSDGNRYLLARIPVLADNRACTLKKEIEQHGEIRSAARLRGDHKSSDLTDALRQDEHLCTSLTIPGKDNGFDIEGLAVTGDRIFIGLRGPVLRGWAVILEVELKEDKDNTSTLRLKKIKSHNRIYRKHFLELGGLGIRDLCIYGSDLLILAGPTMNLDGPVTLFRWPDGTRPKGESVMFADQLAVVMEIPYGQNEHKGLDHAEGMTLFGEDSRSILIVYDSPTPDRKRGDHGVTADLFELPS